MKPKLLLSLALVLSGHCYAAITYREAPEEGRRITYEKVSRVVQAFTNAFNGLTIAELKITNALRMYAVSQQDVISENLLSAAKFGGWDYLVMHGTNAVFEVPLLINPKDGKLVKSGGASGSAGRTLAALQKAEALPQTKKEDYEPHYLSMSMSFSAVWLHGKTNDIIIPLPPAWGKWNVYQPYPESEITKLLKPVAEDDLKHNGNMMPTFKRPISDEKFDPFERKGEP